MNDSSGKKNAPAPSEQAPPDSNEQSESHKEPDSKEKRSPKPSVDHSEDIQRKDSKQERQRSDSLSKVNSAAVEQCKCLWKGIPENSFVNMVTNTQCLPTQSFTCRYFQSGSRQSEVMLA